MQKFEAYLEQAADVKNSDELFNLFVTTMTEQGFDKVLFGLLTDHHDIQLKAGVGVMENYPDDWMKFYFENAFDKIDPIVTYGVHQSGAFAWSDIPKHVKLAKTQTKCLAMGLEAGLHNGVSIPLRGARHQIAGISLASSEKKDACRVNVDLITAYCNHFYLVYKRLHQKPLATSKNIVLTPKERDVLRWAAIGKTDDEIGEILTISRHTVNMHFRHIYEKVEANNRILAVVKALTMGLVSL